MIIGLFTDASMVAIPESDDIIRTSGWSETARGAAFYLADPLVDASYVAAHPQTSFLSATDGGTPSRGWRLSTDQAINTAQFGVLNGANDSDGFEAAIAFASTNEMSLEVVGVVTLSRQPPVPPLGLILTGNGTIAAGNTANFTLEIAPPMGLPVTVSAIVTVAYPPTDPMAHPPLPAGSEFAAKITVADGSPFDVGDIIMLYSADSYGFDIRYKKAELLNIVAIEGNDLYIGTKPRWSYSTNINVRTLSNSRVAIGPGITFTFAGNPASVQTASLRYAALSIVGAVSPVIEATFADDVSNGLATYSCWQVETDHKVRNLRVNYDLEMYGYGYVSSGADRGGRTTYSAKKCGHSFTVGPFFSAQPSRQGVPIGMVVHDAVAIDCTRAAFDTHPGATDTVFANCLASGGFTDVDQRDKGTINGYQDRGLNTVFENCSSRNLRAPFRCDALMQSYGEDNTTLINGGSHVQNLTSAALPFNASGTKAGTDNNRTLISNVTAVGFQPFETTQLTPIQEFSNCKFVGDGTYGIQWANNMGGFRFENVTFLNFTTLRIGANKVTMLGCKRVNETGTFIEPLVAPVGSSLTIDNYYAEAASYAYGSIVRAGLGVETGTVAINLGRIQAKGFGYANPVSTNGSVTLTLSKVSLDLGGTAIWDPPSLAANTQQSTTVSVIGAAMGDIAVASFSQPLQGTHLFAEVTAADIVTVYQQNYTSSSVDTPSGTLRVHLKKG